MATFDKDTLKRLHDQQEVAIRTAKHPATSVTIWVVSTCGQCAPPRAAGTWTSRRAARQHCKCRASTFR